MKHRLTFLAFLIVLTVGGGGGRTRTAARQPLPSRQTPQPRTPAGADDRRSWRTLGSAAVEAQASLVVPPGVRIVGQEAALAVRLEEGETRRLVWNVEADQAGAYPLRLQVTVGTEIVANESLAMDFLPALEARQLPYIPEPVPARTTVLVGAHHCPLWEADKPYMWANIVKHPERTPALGFYAQENPEVADWETKWAVEHGISFFVYCWYRTSQGGAVKTQFGSAIHDALFKSRFADKMKFTIMWENQSRGKAGVADERDLMENLLPYWMTNYFQHPSYLKVDNKPVLFIYRPEFLVQDLGGVENVNKAFERMRQACRDAGFDGLYLLGEYRGLDPNHLRLMKQLGLDYTFAYCWHVQNNPTPAQAIAAQLDSIRKTQQLGILPQVVTVSQAWSGWRDEGSIWKIPPTDFETLLRQAKDFIATLPANQLGSKMLLLDNWNEWGEGHYIAPYREFGFGYLDAVRKVFSDAPEPHVDLIPEDIGLGPYDTAYRTADAGRGGNTPAALEEGHQARGAGGRPDCLVGVRRGAGRPGDARLFGPSPGRPAARRNANQRSRRPRPGLRRRVCGGGKPSPAFARQCDQHRVLGQDRSGRTGQQVVRESSRRGQHLGRLSPGRAGRQALLRSAADRIQPPPAGHDAAADRAVGACGRHVRRPDDADLCGRRGVRHDGTAGPGQTERGASLPGQL